MGFFDEDDFGFGIEDIFKKFAGDGFVEYSSIGPDGKKKNFRRYGGSRRIPAKQIVTPKEVFFIFDFSSEGKIDVNIKDEIAENRYGQEVHTGKKILEIKNNSGVIGEFLIPDKIKFKNYEYSFNNGILEVKFKR